MVYCREGFEADAGQELAAKVSDILSLTGIIGAKRQLQPVTTLNSAFVMLPLASAEELMGLRKMLGTVPPPSLQPRWTRFLRPPACNTTEWL